MDIGRSLKIRSVKLKFSGKARTSWSEHETRNDGDTDWVTYYAKEQYFKHKITLHGDALVVNGEHVYPFYFELPRQLPSTYNGDHGHVLYTAKATIDIPWARDKKEERSFNVISPINLNAEPLLAEPVQQEHNKYLCCCCCKSGPVTLVVNVPYTGFVSGQTIPITIELDNMSDVIIDDVKVKLKKSTWFKSQHPSRKTKSTTSELTLLNLHGVGANTSRTWTEQMTIPTSVTVENLDCCGIITENFELKVLADTGNMHGNAKVKVSIKMGNVPLSIARYSAGYPAQHVNPAKHGPSSADAVQPQGFFERAPVPGFVQQVLPYDGLETRAQQQQPTAPELRFVKQPLYPPTQVHGQPQLPQLPQLPQYYPANVNVEHLSFYKSDGDRRPEVNSYDPTSFS